MKDKLKNINVFFLQHTYKLSYYHITCNHFLRILKGKEDTKELEKNFVFILKKKIIKIFGYMRKCW